ncbi:MAG: DUF3458 domain-containing protein, partial [Pseudomonadota bacterium]
ASHLDLSQFRRWYTDAGRPVVRIENNSDGAFALTQSTSPTPGQPDKPARVIPFSYAAYGAQSGDLLDEGQIELRDETASLRIEGANEPVVLSALRGFSAPVSIDYDLTVDDRLALMAYDRDPFNRWSVANGLWRHVCLQSADNAGDDSVEKFAAALGAALDGASDDPAFAAELLKPPSASELAQTATVIDPQAIVDGRRRVVSAVAHLLADRLRARYAEMQTNAPYAPDAESAGRRALKNAALSLLVAAGDDALADEQATSAANMTDEAAAVIALAVSDSDRRETALDRFYQKWRGESLVVNKWLSWRALHPGDEALDDVIALLNHDAYDAGNPNKVRALIGAFARENIAALHRVDGAGYAFFIEQVEAIDGKNPQLAARLVGMLENWPRLAPPLRDAAADALQRLADPARVSENVFEMVDRLLKA